jgi:5'-nucleotidase
MARPRRGLAAFASLALLASIAYATPSNAAETYALPGAPTNVLATSVAGGIQVTWNAPANTGGVPLSSYTVTGGAGTCAITVPATATSAFIPATVGQPGQIFSVTATNSLGNSGEGFWNGVVAPKAAFGARVVTASGSVAVVGTATSEITSAGTKVTVAASTRDGRGLWSADASGKVSAFGTATDFGAALANVVAIIPTKDDKGLTLVSRSGKVASFGTATLNTSVKGSVAGAVPTADDKGLWIVRNDGTIVSVGTAAKAAKLRGPIATVTGNTSRTGGWAVRSNGTVVAFGGAAAITGKAASKPISAWHTTGNGVWVLNADGTISSFGDAATTYARVKGAVSITGAAADMLVSSVTVDYLSDFHGQIEALSGVGGAAALTTYFKADKALGNTIVASSGDNIGAAPPISSQFDEVSTILSLNEMGLDVSTFGNHEHDKPLSHLNSMLEKSTAQWVVSNYSSLAAIPKAKTFTIIEKNGIKVGFVGTNTPETPQVVAPANLGGITISATPEVGVNKAIADARAAGAHVVVVLAHLGFAEFQGNKAVGPLIDLAGKVQGADLITGGHTHLKWAGRVNGTLVQQVVNAGQSYARANICLDKATGMVIGSGNQYVTPTAANVVPDAKAAALVKSYADQLAAKFDSKIGTVNGVFPFGGNPAVQRQGEVAIGDFLADALRAKYKTDFVVINGGGIRANIPALNYTPKDTTLRRPTSASSTGTFDLVLGDIYTVLPFGNQIATTSVTGAQLWAALENGVSQVEASAGRFPQISGFKFAFDAKAAVGSRVTSVTTLTGTPIAKDSKEYTLTTLDFMINGGDGYTQFNPTKAVIRDLYAQDIVDAILAKPEVTIPALDGRIARTN